MASLQTSSILHQLRQMVLRHDGAGMSDGQLLRSFLSRRDEAAFEALVRRHGPMVRGVCRRVLRNAHDAEDAFQAAFLVLLRKAPALAAREVIGDWLHGVAYRTALKGRTADARRRAKEKRISRSEVIAEENCPEWHALLDQEVGRLPEKYRLPVVFCDLEGRTRKEAAHQLGWPEGTLSGRLARARAMLARRLTRRGVVLSATALAAALAREAAANLPISQVHSTCKAAAMFAAGQTAGIVSAKVVALTEGVVRAMLMDKLKTIAVLLSSFLVLGIGVGAWRHVAAAGQGEERREEKPVLPTRDERKAPAVPAIPSVERKYQIDLSIARVKDGHRNVIDACLRTPEGKEASFAKGEKFPVDVGGDKVETVVMGPAVRVIVRKSEGGRVCLDITVSQPTDVTLGVGALVETKSVRAIQTVKLGEPLAIRFRTGDKDSSLLTVTAAVTESDERTDAKKIESAEKDLKRAEFYRRTGHPDSARFYYELICRRYPDTLYAERAKERLAEEKPPARVGQIFIIGNEKTKDDVILEQVQLYPGQVLTYPDLAIAEKRLSRLKGFKTPPKVTVINEESDGEFKDIKITVEEK